ncbi:hypothetical protein SAMN06297251_1288 [Fulvimarina manganoxydans]|uniref:Uncharacterized protein n=1 Tax=Fulvimarina manganoxydans TaxID=937218 RepID=A0A1W2ELV0_9HYPH|nr:hypothetical protein SAMN06297251_1288 [Fulvimarina manganoxydans]
MGPAKPAKTLLDQRRISENPAIDSRMIDREAALGEHFLKVPIAERIAQRPCHRLNDQPRLELPTFEIVLRRPPQLFDDRAQDHGKALRW